MDTRNDSQILESKRAGEWLGNCLSQGMHVPKLVSADRESRSGFERKLTSQAGTYVGAFRSPTEAHDLLRRFNPRLVGFGIARPSSSHLFGSSELADTRSRNEICKKSQEAK